MTAPIKHCPQPDPPELVMRADGYHYRTEDDMKELTDEQKRATKEGHRNKAEDNYFNARPQAGFKADRVYFKAGFDRGWDAAKNDAPADRDVIPEYSDLCEKPEAERSPLDTFILNNEPADPELENQFRSELKALISWLAAAPTPPAEQPIDMVLHCPKCGKQHIDAPESEPTTYTDGHETVWRNPAHRSHLCHGCGHIWRPADVATNGVQAIKTKGKNDSASAEQQGEQEPNSVVDTTLKNLRRLLEHHKTFQARVADLRAKVEALQTIFDHSNNLCEMVEKEEVLTLIDNLGGGV